jgi:hypothetical protein
VKPLKERRLCKCPIGNVLATCPFSFSNAWHERRDAVLLQCDLDVAKKRVAQVGSRKYKHLLKVLGRLFIEDDPNADSPAIV